MEELLHLMLQVLQQLAVLPQVSIHQMPPEALTPEKVVVTADRAEMVQMALTEAVAVALEVIQVLVAKLIVIPPILLGVLAQVAVAQVEMITATRAVAVAVALVSWGKEVLAVLLVQVVLVAVTDLQTEELMVVEPLGMVILPRPRVILAEVALYVLFGVQAEPSHQQIQGMCNGTLYSH
jgi:hypothetical protein